MEKTLKPNVTIFWFRRDLRLHDNAGLFHALKGPHPVVPVFVFDKKILERLSEAEDRRVQFIRTQLHDLQGRLEKVNSSLEVIHATPKKAFLELLSKYDVQEVIANKDYEPYARRRDEEIYHLLKPQGIILKTYKDQVIFEESEVVKSNGEPYNVFTPYSRRWKERLYREPIQAFETEFLHDNFYKNEPHDIPALEEIGFQTVDFTIPQPDISEKLIKNYKEYRDFPGIEGTTYAGVHLRFGTLSVRELVLLAQKYSETWLNELIWREFFMMILFHFPQVEHHNFRRKYDRVTWRNNEDEFHLWCRGETGYPIVDAGMRQLNKTGWMHNRVRMITAGFLTKHLLIDWRWGEAFFAEKLLDYELASNNGNWQWAAGTGCDSAPWFRIFNPHTQLKKFDPQLHYVKKWIPNFHAGYLPEVVEHSFARARALETYKKVLNA